jgi:hypothetical protein
MAIAESPPLAPQAAGNINGQVFAERGIYGCLPIAANHSDAGRFPRAKNSINSFGATVSTEGISAA